MEILTLTEFKKENYGANNTKPNNEVFKEYIQYVQNMAKDLQNGSLFYFWNGKTARNGFANFDDAKEKFPLFVDNSLNEEEILNSNFLVTIKTTKILENGTKQNNYELISKIPTYQDKDNKYLADISMPFEKVSKIINKQMIIIKEKEAREKMEEKLKNINYGPISSQNICYGEENGYSM